MLVLLFACHSPTNLGLEIDRDLTEEETVLGILIAPEQLTVPVGGNAQLSATAITNAHRSFDVTESVDWMVEFYDIIEISDSLDSEGQLSALSEGSSRIYALYDDIRSPFAEVVVSSAQIESIHLSVEELDVLEGEQIQLQAYASFSDGTEGNITQQLRWKTEDATVVQFPNAGLLLAKNTGQTSIQAIYQSDHQEKRTASIPVQVHPYFENGSADLTFESIELSIDNDELIVSGMLLNQGSQSASNFWIDLFVQGEEPKNGDIGDHFHYVNYLAPNHGIGVHFRFSLAGPSTIWLMADSKDEIDESHENNNLISIDHR